MHTHLNDWLILFLGCFPRHVFVFLDADIGPLPLALVLLNVVKPRLPLPTGGIQ